MTKEQLQKDYEEELMSQDEIAKKYKISRNTVRKLLVTYELKKRNMSDSALLLKTKYSIRNPHAVRIIKNVDLQIVKWEIKDYQTKKRNHIKAIFFIKNGQEYMIDVVSGNFTFLCQSCKKVKTLGVYYYFQNNEELICRDCRRNKTRSDAGFHLTDEAKKAISIKKTGVLRNNEYFDFTCPICNETFQYRDLYRNRIKKYCSEKCQLSVWIKAGSSSPEKQGKIFEYDVLMVLNELGYKSEMQKMIAKRFPVDFYLPEIDIYLQADGIYWHGKPELYKDEDLDDNQKRHRINDAEFERICVENNIKYSRFWQDDFYNNKIETIKTAINSALNK